jgi:hypothetical protein
LAKYFYAPSILFERRFRMCATNIWRLRPRMYTKKLRFYHTAGDGI